MPLTTQLLSLGVTEAKIAPVTTNTSSTYATGAYVAAPGIKTMTLTAKLNTKEATGDEVIMDAFVLNQGFDVSFENQMLDLNQISTINGSTLTQTGTTPNQINTLVDAGTDVPVMFNLHFRTLYINKANCDFHMEAYCVKGYLDVGVKSGDYWSCSFKGMACARQSDKKFRAITFNETATAIPANPTAGVATLASNMAKTDVGGTVIVSLTGTTFVSKAAAETATNYTFGYTTTGLGTPKITYINANTVAIAFTGTAAAGTLSITPKAAGLANALDATAGTYTMT